MPLRPRARSTFAQKLSRARARAGRFVAAPVETRPPGRPPARALRAPDMGGPVLVIGPDSALRVLGGPLDVEHGFKPDRARLRINVDEPKPAGILFDAHGEFLTGEAIRWCARYAIPLILPNGPGRAILFYESALEADGAGEGVNGKHAARILDVGPSLVRAQALADPVPVARAIVSAKLKASAESVPAIDKRLWSLRLDEARSVGEIVTIEARIAAAYWRAFRDLGLRERKGGDLPRSWLRFANRQKGAQFLGSKHALHPINAMLNYAYVVEAGRLARAWTAAGFALTIGFLHSDTRAELACLGCDRAAAPLNRRAGVQVHRVTRVRPVGLPSGRAERASARSRDHRRASAGFAVAVGTARGRGAMDGEDDRRRRQTTSKGLKTNVNSKRMSTCHAPRPRYSRRHRPDLWGRRSHRLQSRPPRHRLHAGREAILKMDRAPYLWPFSLASTFLRTVPAPVAASVQSRGPHSMRRRPRPARRPPTARPR